jgi:hypothetical protein
MTLRFTKLRVETKPKVDVYADNTRIGSTPADIAADVAALTVLVPKSAPKGRTGRAGRPK